MVYMQANNTPKIVRDVPVNIKNSLDKQNFIRISTNEFEVENQIRIIISAILRHMINIYFCLYLKISEAVPQLVRLRCKFEDAEERAAFRPTTPLLRSAKSIAFAECTCRKSCMVGCDVQSGLGA